MTSKSLLLFSFLFASIASFAQHELQPCGTQDGRVDWLKHYQQHPEAYPRSMEDTLYMPITVHIVGNDDGSGYFDIKSMLSSFCTLNKDFAASNIQFFIKGPVRYINNTNYNNHGWQDGAAMIQQHRVARTINCFIVENPADNCGYSSYNRGIALAKNCTSPNSHTWAHEVGHHLSLPHPFFGWEGYDHDYTTPAPNFIDGHRVERMDGTHCTQAGDGFCDTPPDYLNDRFSCDGDSLSTITQITPDNVEFKTDGTLIMSYSRDGCSSRFSEDQKAAMRANILTEKADYLHQGEPVASLFETPVQMILPEEDSHIDTYQEVLFEWEALEGALDVQLEISPLPNFSVILLRYDVTDVSSLLVTELLEDKTFYWRLRAYNGWDNCNIYSESASFSVGSVTSVSSLPILKGISIAPNPIVHGQSLLVQTDLTKAMTIQGKLVNVAGMEVLNFEWYSHFGQQEQSISTNKLQPGIYFLQLQSEEGVWSEKVLVVNN